MADNKRYINDRELSEQSGIPLPTLRIDRQKDRRIPFIRIGRSIYYDTATIFDVIAQKFGVGGRQPGVIVKTTKPIRRRVRAVQS